MYNHVGGWKMLSRVDCFESPNLGDRHWINGTWINGLRLCYGWSTPWLHGRPTFNPFPRGGEPARFSKIQKICCLKYYTKWQNQVFSNSSSLQKNSRSIFSPQKPWLGYCVSMKLFYFEFMKWVCFYTKFIDQKNW